MRDVQGIPGAAVYRETLTCLVWYRVGTRQCRSKYQGLQSILLVADLLGNAVRIHQENYQVPSHTGHNTMRAVVRRGEVSVAVVLLL